ncbi:MAG: hypothetical protein MUO64_20485 [Anaerolineales bacterium]|nr:hypothetical protein [Anaerolineales bacterium]
MDVDLDLIVYPLGQSRESSQNQALGLYASLPPRSPARGRSADRLILHINLTGNAPLDPKQQTKLLEQLAKLYYRTSGSVTNAMRLIVEQLNRFLLERNLKGGTKGLQSIGLLTMAVVRSGRIYLAQCGPTQAFLVTAQEAHHLFDPQEARRGLGKNRLASIRYWQFELHPKDYLLITPNPPPAWVPTTLQAVYGQGLGKLYRLLTGQVEVDRDAVLVMAFPGSGRLHLSSPQMASQGEGIASPDEKRSVTQRLPRKRPSLAGPSWLSTIITSIIARLPSRLPSKSLPATRPGRIPTRGGQPASPVTNGQSLQPPLPGSEPPPKAETASIPQPGSRPHQAAPAQPRQRSTPKPSVNKLAFLWEIPTKVGRTISQRLHLGDSVLLERLTQVRSQTFIPSSMMAFIAIAVPVVVVTITSMIYLQSGRTTLYESYYQQAYTVASQSLNEKDPDKLHLIWQSSLEYLDKSEDYRITDESQKLRAYIQSNMDTQEGIERLDFQPMIWGGLPNTVKISRIVVTDEDLYLLNAANGSVLRATRTGRGYEIDRQFQCSPNINIGTLVDITSLPRDNPEKAVVLGMDARGTLIYCRLNDAPQYKSLPSPDMDWGKPQILALEEGNLYVLDIKDDAIWVFFPNEKDGEYSTSPSYYFTENRPILQDGTAMVIHQTDMYLLHQDGHLTTCTYDVYHKVPTRCVDPAMFTDFRSTQEKVPLITGAHFDQVLYAPPPDPSIYMLDAEARAIYHFSLKLTLQRQYRPRQALPEGLASTFALGLDRRTFFMALGDNVYSATIP